MRVPPDSVAASGSHGRRRLWVSLLRLSVLTLVLYFVVVALWNRFSQVDWNEISFGGGFLLLALLAALASRLLTGLLLGVLLKRFGHPVTSRSTMAVAWVSALGKYVPGKLASLASGIYLLTHHQVRAPVAATVLALMSGLSATVGLLIALPLLFSDQVSEALPLSRVWFCLLLVIGLVALWPRVFFAIANFVFGRMGRSGIPATVTSAHMLLPVALVACQCVASGVATWSVARAIMDIPLITIPIMVSISSLAGAVGLLAVFTPAGLGVREGIYLLALNPVVGYEVAALVAVGMRLLQTVADVLAGSLGVVILRHSAR